MHELYRLISDPWIGELLTIITMGLLCLGYLSFVWGNSQRLNTQPSTLSWAQIYFFGLMVFLLGATLLGKLIVPRNTDELLNMVGLNDLLHYVTVRFQMFMQSLLRLFM